MWIEFFDITTYEYTIEKQITRPMAMLIKFETKIRKVENGLLVNGRSYKFL